ncbi:MAG: hypothetical protein FWH19_00460 [Treponema sp.]|nr:hypothetical protein [Treponema sp.]
MRIKRLLLCVVLIAGCSIALFAVDFGLILDQNAGFSGNGDESAFEYSGILVPRLSALLGERGELFVSAGMQAGYQDDEWKFAPELLRTEISARFGGGAIMAGRMYYSDPLGYISEGLFDGGRLSFDTAAAGTFGAGAWYTGFLYKNRANIAMTQAELEAAALEVDLSDLENSYFAPSRFVAALDWEHPSFLDVLMMNFAILGQFDLSEGDLNSQYLVGSIALPLRNFIFDLGGCLELIQDSGESGTAFSADLGAVWALSANQRLAFLARYTSGSSDSTEAFLPITTKSQGFVLKANHSGITMLSLDYSGRLNRSASVGLSSSYFIRNDMETYANFGDEGNLLGNEFSGRLFWSPVSDLQFNLWAGIFLPSMGDVSPDAKSIWRVELSMIVSLF